MKEQKLKLIKPFLFKGMTIEQTAKQTGLSISTIKRYKEQIKREFLEQIPKQECKLLNNLIEETLEVIDQIKEDLQAIKQDTQDNKTKLRSLDLLLKCTNQKITILQSLGLLPKQIEVEQTQEYSELFVKESISKYINRNKIDD